MARFTIEAAREFLRRAQIMYTDDIATECAEIDADADYTDEQKAEYKQEVVEGAQILNMNDCFGWALAWGKHVPDEDLVELAELIWRYGWCGALYYTSEHSDKCRSEFADNQRFIDFVRSEEAIRKEVPNSNRRAYHKVSYQLPAEGRSGGG